ACAAHRDLHSFPTRRSSDLSLQLGTFATRTVVHSAAAIPIGDELPPEQACLLGCAVATGVGSALYTAAVWEGARVGVIGCGAVGDRKSTRLNSSHRTISYAV